MPIKSGNSHTIGDIASVGSLDTYLNRKFQSLDLLAVCFRFFFISVLSVPNYH